MWYHGKRRTFFTSSFKYLWSAKVQSTLSQCPGETQVTKTDTVSASAQCTIMKCYLLWLERMLWEHIEKGEYSVLEEQEWFSGERMKLKWEETSKQKKLFGLPWWRSGWESACQCRGHGFEPWSGKIPHAMEQLGPWATITEPARLEPMLRNKRGRDNERPRAPRWRVAPTCCN